MNRSGKRVAVIGVAVTAGVLVLAASSWVSAQEPAQRPGAAQPGPVQMKRAPIQLDPAPAPSKLEGAAIQGNTIKANPGYELVPGPNQTMMIRRAAGGGLGHTFDGCGCKGGTGTCTVTTTSPTSATCGKKSGDTCGGECTFSTTGSRQRAPNAIQ